MIIILLDFVSIFLFVFHEVCAIVLAATAKTTTSTTKF